MLSTKRLPSQHACPHAHEEQRSGMKMETDGLGWVASVKVLLNDSLTWDALCRISLATGYFAQKPRHLVHECPRSLRLRHAAQRKRTPLYRHRTPPKKNEGSLRLRQFPSGGGLSTWWRQQLGCCRPVLAPSFLCRSDLDHVRALGRERTRQCKHRRQRSSCKTCSPRFRPSGA